MNRISIALAAALSITLLFQACESDSIEDLIPPPPPPPDTVSWSMEVEPIISGNCGIAGCHLDTQMPFLTNHTEVTDNLNRVETRALIERTMPPTGALPKQERDLIGKWIMQGAPNN